MLYLFPIAFACTASKIGQAGVACNGATKKDVDIDYGVAGDNVKLCIRNNVDDGWIALAPGSMMQGSGLVAGWGSQASGFAFAGFNIKSGGGLGHTNGMSKTDGGKRILCFDIAKGKISGDMSAASFQWARGSGEMEAGNKHERYGSVTLDLTKLPAATPPDGSSGGGGDPASGGGNPAGGGGNPAGGGGNPASGGGNPAGGGGANGESDAGKIFGLPTKTVYIVGGAGICVVLLIAGIYYYSKNSSPPVRLPPKKRRKK